MRVLLLPWNYELGGGGLENCIFNISKRLKDRNVKVIVVAGRVSPEEKKVERINGVFVYRIYPHLCWSNLSRPQHPLRIIRKLIVNLPSIFRLVKIVRFFKIDIISLHYLSPAATYVFWIAKILKIKVVASLHGELTQGVHHGGMFEKRLFKNLIKSADMVIACSEDLLKQATSLCPGISDRSKVVFNGIDLAKFNFNFQHNFRKNYIFALGNFWLYKGFDLLIAAFAHLVEKQYAVNLVIAGRGAQEVNLKILTRLFKMEDRVFFYGLANDEEKILLLKGSLFFVLPSRIEPFGIVNLEAMAAGKAIVATRTGGVPEIVQDGINGILVEPYNDEALAAGMIRLLDDQDLRERLGRNGRQLIKDQKFSWDNIANQYIKLYRRVLQKQ